MKLSLYAFWIGLPGSMQRNALSQRIWVSLTLDTAGEVIQSQHVQQQTATVGSGIAVDLPANEAIAR